MGQAARSSTTVPASRRSRSPLRSWAACWEPTGSHSTNGPRARLACASYAAACQHQRRGESPRAEGDPEHAHAGRDRQREGDRCRARRPTASAGAPPRAPPALRISGRATISLTDPISSYAYTSAGQGDVSAASAAHARSSPTRRASTQAGPAAVASMNAMKGWNAHVSGRRSSRALPPQQRVGAGGVARGVVGVDERPVGAARVQVRVVLAVADQVVGAQHVHGGVRQRHVGGERGSAGPEDRRERERVREPHRRPAATFTRATPRRACAAGSARARCRRAATATSRYGVAGASGTTYVLSCETTISAAAPTAGNSIAGSTPPLALSTSDAAPIQSSASTTG